MASGYVSLPLLLWGGRFEGWLARPCAEGDETCNRYTVTFEDSLQNRIAGESGSGRVLHGDLDGTLRKIILKAQKIAVSGPNRRAKRR